jgi:hypothetical protein
MSLLWDSAPELASNQTVIQHVFPFVNFLFAIRLYKRNDSHPDMSDMHSWLSGQSGALSSRSQSLLKMMR